MRTCRELDAKEYPDCLTVDRRANCAVQLWVWIKAYRDTRAYTKVWLCANQFGFRAAYQGQCDLECSIDYYEVNTGVTCKSKGYSGAQTCGNYFSADRAYKGYCDFACNFCPIAQI